MSTVCEIPTGSTSAFNFPGNIPPGRVLYMAAVAFTTGGGTTLGSLTDVVTRTVQ